MRQHFLGNLIHFHQSIFIDAGERDFFYVVDEQRVIIGDHADVILGESVHAAIFNVVFK